MPQTRNAKQIMITLEPEIREALEPHLERLGLKFSAWVRQKAREEIRQARALNQPYRIERGKNVIN